MENLSSKQTTQNVSIPDIIISKLTANPSTPLSTLDLASELKVPHQDVVGACKSLEMAEIIVASKQENTNLVFTKDGKEILQKGSPEFEILKYLHSASKESPVLKKAVTEHFDKTHRGFATAMKLKYLDYDSKTDIVSIKSTIDV